MKVFKYPEGEMTEKQWVSQYAERVEERKVDWYSLLDKKKWNLLNGDKQKEYQKKLEEKAKKSSYRAWRGDIYYDISKETYDWAILNGLPSIN